MARIKEEDMRLRLVVEGGDAVRKAMADLKDNIAGVENSLKSLTRQREAAIKAEGEESAKVKGLTTQIQAEQSRLDDLTGKYKKYESQLKVNNMTLAELRKHLRNTQAALASAVPGTQNWKRLNVEVQNTKRRLQELRRATSATQAAMSRLAKAGGFITAAFAAARGVASLLSGAVNTIKDFEQANANLSTILGKSVNDIKGLTESALELGRTTEYTASQVTGLQTELAKLGFTEPQIQAMQEPVLHFATAVGAELPEAASLAGATLRIFGLNASDTEETLATLALATNKSALDFSFLQEAMSTVGPVANSFGFSMRDTTTLLGALANAGFDASSAATATRNILLNLADGSGKLATALGGPVRTFPELMDGLARLNAQGVDLNTTLELTDKRSVAAFNAFLSGVDASNELHDALGETDGALKRIADERMNTLEGSVKLLKSAWEGLILSFRKSSGVLKSITDALRRMVEAMTPGNAERKKMEATYQAAEEYVKEYHDNVLKYNEDVAKSRLSAQVEAAEAEAKAIADQQWQNDTKENRRRLEAATARVDALHAALDVISKQEAADSAAVPDMPAAGASGSNTGGKALSGGKKSNKQWSLQGDEAFLRAKAELTRRFNEGEIASKELFDEELYRLEVSSLTARLATGKEKGLERAKLEEQLQGTIYKHKTAAAESEKKLQKEARALLASLETDKTRIALAAEDERYRKEKEQWDKRSVSEEERRRLEEALERKHAQNLLKIRLDADTEALAHLKEDNEQRKRLIFEKYEAELLSARPGSGAEKAIRGAIAFEQAKEDLKYLEGLRQTLQRTIDAGEIDGQALTDEQIKALQQQLNTVVSQVITTRQAVTEGDAGFFSAAGGGSLFGVSQDAWEQFFARLADGKLKAQDLQTLLSGLGGAAEEGLSLASEAIDVTNAKEKAEFDDWKKANEEKKADLQKRLDHGLISQEAYNAQLAKMQEDEAQREADINLEQGKRAKTLAIVESIINTSLAVTKSLSQYAWPWNLIPAGIVGAMGAAQTAMIASKPVGYAGGGRHRVERAQDGRSFSASYEPGKRGYVNSPTILVGEEGGEYIVPAEGLANPSLAPILNTIEAARRRGTLRNLNLSAVYPTPGYDIGGYTRHPMYPVPAGSIAENEGLISVLSRLAERLESPFQAEVAMLGRHGIVETQEEYQRLRNNGTL